jgi:hypothetical protein
MPIKGTSLPRQPLWEIVGKEGARLVPFTNQSIIVWTPETKSLLPSLYKREEFPSLAKRG